jgi:site-specific recombinase XerD
MSIKKIKDNINEKEFKHLINYLKADTSIRANRKERLERLFTILYLLGLRVNETTQLTNEKMIEFIETKQTKVKAHKQGIEKFIYLSDNGLKMIKKLFPDLENNDKLIFTSERGGKNSPMGENSIIRDVNSYL